MAMLLVCLISLSAGADDRRPMPEPPYVFHYGYTDAARPLWTDTLDCVNIITGSTEDAAFAKELRARGVMFAWHVNARAEAGRETPRELADYWCDALENDMNGELPQGFDAVAIDEIGSPDGSPESARICEALRLARERCPDRRFFFWGGWRMGAAGVSRHVPDGQFYDDELRAVLEYADLLLYEMYVREGNPQLYNWVPWAENIEKRVPGILSKTIYGLYISQNHPFVGDDSDKLDFKDLLDEQFHMLANEPPLALTPGVAFWPFYRARADTIAHVNELIRHYRMRGNTDYYGDGDYSQLAPNPGFEEDGSWELEGAEIVEYASLEGVPDKHDPASHGKRCLRMVRGDARNHARQTLSLKPNTWYTASAFCLVASGQGSPVFEPTGHQWTSDLTEWEPWVTPVATFLTDETGQAAIGLTDESMAPGSVTYWDFVEVEECRGINRPTRITDASLADGVLTIRGENIMPGSILDLDGHEPMVIEWLSASEARVTLQGDLDKRKRGIELRKPRWCLHPHVAYAAIEF